MMLKKIKNIWEKLKKYNLEINLFVSLIILLFISPLLAIFWLILATICYLCYGNYKSIFLIWGFFFFSWYFFFTACLIGYSDPIWIGGEHTAEIFYYFSIENPTLSVSHKWYTFIFEGFYVQTLLILHCLSGKLGFPLYIPSIFKGVLALLKYLF